MCPGDCILRGTDPRKHFLDKWYEGLSGTLDTGSWKISDYPEQGLKSTLVPRIAGARSKGQGEGMLTINYKIACS